MDVLNNDEMMMKQIANDVSRYSILVGFLLIIIFVAPCVAFALLSKYCQKQATDQKRKSRYSGTYQDDVLGGGMPQPAPDSKSGRPRAYSYSVDDATDSFGTFGQVELEADQIMCLERIVSVAPGPKCLETWKAYAPKAVSKTQKLITVKKLAISQNTQHASCLCAKLNALSCIPPHPHLLNLLGVCVNGGVPSALMLEYPPHGSLHSFLLCKAKARISGSAGMWPGLTNQVTERDLVVVCRNADPSLHDILLDPAVVRRPFVQPLNESFIEEDELVFAIQIASVMEHLASKGIPHHKLSTENLVVSAGYFLKLTGVEFENPLLHRSSSLIRLKRAPSGRNLVKWDAPEVMEKGEYSEQSEVWRFGMTLWEIATIGDTPFVDFPYRQLLETLKNGERPPKPGDCSDRLYNLMSGCWAMTPEDRPSFHQLLGRIRTMLDFGSRKTSAEESPTPTLLLPHQTSIHQRLLRRPYGSIRSNRSSELQFLSEPNTPPVAAEDMPAGYLQTDV